MTTDVDFTTAVSQHFPSLAPRASLDCPAFNVPPAEALAVLQHLRDAHAFDFLMDLTAIDWSAEKSPRFTVVWHLYSSTSHRYVRVAADCAAAGLALAEWHTDDEGRYALSLARRA